MNKQPFYHFGYLNPDKSNIKEEKIKNIITKIPTTLKNTFEFDNNELLFTATSDVSKEATQMLKAIGIIFEYEINAEPGDPSDLM